MQRVACEHCGSRLLASSNPRHCPTCGKRGRWETLKIEGVPEALTKAPSPPTGGTPTAAGPRPGAVTGAAVIMLINAGLFLLAFVAFLVLVFGLFGLAGSTGVPLLGTFVAGVLAFVVLMLLLLLGVPGGLSLASGIGALKGRGWGRILTMVTAGILGMWSLYGVIVGAVVGDPVGMTMDAVGLVLNGLAMFLILRPESTAWFAAVAAARAAEAAEAEALRKALAEALVASATKSPTGSSRYAPRTS